MEDWDWDGAEDCWEEEGSVEDESLWVAVFVEWFDDGV